MIIGLTGGIGSGKSAAADRFAEAHGIHVVDADIKSRVVVEPGRPALARIVDRFGDAVLLDNGQLNRPALREVVFRDPTQRLWLEELLHPLIREEIVNDLASAQSPYALLVSPLLIESGQHRMTERVIVVDVPESIQLARTAARDQVPLEQVRAIMEAQATRDDRLSQAHDVILNDGDLAALHALLVSPLLIESGQHRMTERVIVVDVPESIQLARTAARDQVPLEQVRAIMEAQATRDDRLSQAHDVILNDGDLAALHAQVDALHDRYLAMLSGGRP